MKGKHLSSLVNRFSFVVFLLELSSEGMSKTFFSIWVRDYRSILKLPPLCSSWNTLWSWERSCHASEPLHRLDLATPAWNKGLYSLFMALKTKSVLSTSSSQSWRCPSSDKAPTVKGRPYDEYRLYRLAFDSYQWQVSHTTDTDTIRLTSHKQ